MLMPIARGRDRMVADRHHGAAGAALHQIGGARQHHQRTATVKIIEPLVGIERQAERRHPAW